MTASIQLPCCYPLLEPNEDNPVYAVIKLTNWVREIHGVHHLRVSNELIRSAQAKSEEMFWRKYFAHVNPDGKGPPRDVGENLSMGRDSAIEVIEALCRSKGHHDNMIDPTYTRIGVGVVTRPNKLHRGWTWIWTQHFS